LANPGLADAADLAQHKVAGVTIEFFVVERDGWQKYHLIKYLPRSIGCSIIWLCCAICCSIKVQQKR
jgi:hypothetical protein